ncbi:MAG TPA: FHA domain-containing protein, partial [Polyangiaceae bacterium]|nr:FHA domain-containing protein [Polyangiaceae bacterium]
GPGFGGPAAAPGFGAQPAPGFGAQPAPGFGAQPAAGPDFMYGGQPPQYGLTGAIPQANMPPPDPYAAGGQAMPGASRAVLSGAAGTYPVMPGVETNVGRDGARCQVLLQEPRVSGVHATLRFDGGQLLVRDGGSNNGTFLNGNRLPPNTFTPVPPGSMLRFGPVEFLVRLE